MKMQNREKWIFIEFFSIPNSDMYMTKGGHTQFLGKRGHKLHKSKQRLMHISSMQLGLHISLDSVKQNWS